MSKSPVSMKRTFSEDGPKKKQKVNGGEDDAETEKGVIENGIEHGSSNEDLGKCADVTKNGPDRKDCVTEKFASIVETLLKDVTSIPVSPASPGVSGKVQYNQTESRNDDVGCGDSAGGVAETTPPASKETSRERENWPVDDATKKVSAPESASQRDQENCDSTSSNSGRNEAEEHTNDREDQNICMEGNSTPVRVSDEQRSFTKCDDSSKGVLQKETLNDERSEMASSNTPSEEESPVQKCQICGRRFREPEKYKEHLKVHSDPVDCESDKEDSTASDGGTPPAKRLRVEADIECTVCSLRFELPEELSKHLKLHSKVEFPIDGDKTRKVSDEKSSDEKLCVENLKCDVCGKRFSDSEKFHKHLKVHSALNCDATASSSGRNTPVITQVAENLKCDVCGRRFKQPEKLQEHLKVHSDEGNSVETQESGREPRPAPKKTSEIEGSHKCQVCARRFNTAEKLQKHLKVHSEADSGSDNEGSTASADVRKSVEKSTEKPRGEDNLKCEICSKRFTQSDRLQEHMNGHFMQVVTLSTEEWNCSELEEEAPTEKQVDENFKCEVCGRRFKKLEKYQEHLKVHSDETALDSSVAEEPQEMADDPANFTSPSNLKCTVCGKQYKQSIRLAKHMQTHHVQQVSLSEEKVISLEVEITLGKSSLAVKGHVDFMCSFCGRQFKQQEKLLKHLKVHTEKKESQKDGKASPKAARKEPKDQKGLCKVKRERKDSVQDQDGPQGSFNGKCYVCGKRFKQPDKLTQHMKLHSETMVSAAAEASVQHVQEEAMNIQISQGGTSVAVTGLVNYMCSICGRQFNNEEQLAGHVNSHTGEKDKKGASGKKANVAKKKTKQLKIEPATPSSSLPPIEVVHYECDLCGKPFKGQKWFEKHMLTHSIKDTSMSEEKETLMERKADATGTNSPLERDCFHCGTCGKEFKGQKWFEKHILTHSEEEKVSERTGEGRRRASNVDSPSDNRSFGCDICGKSFKQSEKLAKHLKKHSNESDSEAGEYKDATEDAELATPVAKCSKSPSDKKLFGCDICGEQFKQNVKLKAHVKQHSDLNTSAASHKSSVLVKKKHVPPVEVEDVEEEVNLKCAVCGKRFQQSSKYEKHMKTHEDIFSSEDEAPPIKQEKTSTPRKSESEQSTKCTVCSKSFWNAKKYAEHLKTHSEAEPMGDGSMKSQKSDVKTTKKETSRASESAKKTRDQIEDEDKSKCSVCGKTFKNPTKLAAHLETHKEVDVDSSRASSPEMSVGDVDSVSDHNFVDDVSEHDFVDDVDSDGDASPADKVAEDSADEMSSDEKEDAQASKCSVCGKRFESTKKLDAHMKMHSQLRSQDETQAQLTSVETKSASTVGDSSRDSPKKSLVSDDKKSVDADALKCSTCAKKFPDADKLAKHMKTHSEQKSTEDNPPKDIAESLEISEKSHKSSAKDALKCTVCGELFSKSKHLEKHMNNHHEDSGNCDRVADSDDESSHQKDSIAHKTDVKEAKTEKTNIFEQYKQTGNFDVTPTAPSAIVAEKTQSTKEIEKITPEKSGVADGELCCICKKDCRPTEVNDHLKSHFADCLLSNAQVKEVLKSGSCKSLKGASKKQEGTHSQLKSRHLEDFSKCRFCGKLYRHERLAKHMEKRHGDVIRKTEKTEDVSKLNKKIDHLNKEINKSDVDFKKMYAQTIASLQDSMKKEVKSRTFAASKRTVADPTANFQAQDMEKSPAPPPANFNEKRYENNDYFDPKYPERFKQSQDSWRYDGDMKKKGLRWDTDDYFNPNYPKSFSPTHEGWKNDGLPKKRKSRWDIEAETSSQDKTQNNIALMKKVEVQYITKTVAPLMSVKTDPLMSVKTDSIAGNEVGSRLQNRENSASPYSWKKDGYSKPDVDHPTPRIETAALSFYEKIPERPRKMASFEFEMLHKFILSYLECKARLPDKSAQK